MYVHRTKHTTNKGIKTMIVYETKKIKIANFADTSLLRFHPYKESKMVCCSYEFSVIDSNGNATMSTWWKVPPIGLAKSLMGRDHKKVLSLSRMSAIPKDQRDYKVSKALRIMADKLIPIEEFPMLVTFVDTSLGHIGTVYKCSGWKYDGWSEVVSYEDEFGCKVSAYNNGSMIDTSSFKKKKIIIQRYIKDRRESRQ